MVNVVLAQLISKGKPSRSQVVVTGKELNFICGWHQQVDQSIDLVWFLTFFTDFSH
jgi:hypothetical protein